jgi:hypothetical protein
MYLKCIIGLPISSLCFLDHVSDPNNKDKCALKESHGSCRNCSRRLSYVFPWLLAIRVDRNLSP